MSESKIILETEIERSVGAVVTDPCYPPGHTSRYGAIPDRVTDSLPAIEMAERVREETKKRR